ncbi:hypothetical protein H1R20_g5974, partial [Candolleomyces eurysporus]
MSSQGNRSRGNDPTANLLLLEYNGRQTVIPRPQVYQDLRHSLRRYLPDIPDGHDDFSLETKELAMSPGKWVIISKDVFETVVPLVQTVKVVSWARSQPGGQGATSQMPSQTPQNVSKHKRSRKDFDSDPYHVRVQTTTGRTIRVLCSPSDTIANFKAMIQDQEGMPPDQQRLLYNGQGLDENYTLNDYDVQTGATFHIVLRLIGGKPVIYLYPPTATRVSTKLSLVPEWEFSAIYAVVPAKTKPQGQELEWIVDASPNGTLKEVNTGLEVSFLYWEAETNPHNLLSPSASLLLTTTETVTEIFIPNRATIDTTNSVLLEVGKVTP